MKQPPKAPELVSREFDELPEASPSVDPRSETGEDYGLVIGVNHYPDLRPLRGAIADAQAFADWLFNPNGGRVPTGNARVILSTADPLTPIGHEIDDALEYILEHAERTGGRRFYFYFSGHGAVGDRANDIALCLPKWSERRRRAALSSDAWLDIVVRSGLFDEAAFFLDCCRVWATRAIGMPPRIDFAKPTKRENGTRVFMAHATEFQRAAFELDDRSAASFTESRGIFTKVLIDVLRAHVTFSQVVPAAFLKECIEKETEKRARAAGFYQRAEVLNGFHQESGFGSGHRIVGDAGKQSKIESSTSFHGPRQVLTTIRATTKWGDFYEEFRQQRRVRAQRPVTEYPHMSSRLQVVAFQGERGQGSHTDSSAKAWSICSAFQMEDLKSPGPLPYNLGTKSLRYERIEPIPILSETPQVDGQFYFAGALASGAYVLRHNGRNTREFAVRLFRGWTTLIVVDNSLQPHFEHAKLFLIPHTHDEALPAWSSLKQVAIPMTCLNWGLEIPLTRQKFCDPATSFDNPMLGLLAAHLIANLKDPDATRIESIANQVRAMIGTCPDVDALFLRAALIRGGELPRVYARTPPMLREGLLAFVEASHQMPELIPPGSLLEYACVERLVDSPISSWPRRPNTHDSDDWLAASIEDLANQTTCDVATLDATTIAREFGVPMQAVTTRLAVTREHMTRNGARAITASSKDTSARKTVPLPLNASIDRSPVPPTPLSADDSSQETGPLSTRVVRPLATGKPLDSHAPSDDAVPSIPGYQILGMIGKGGMGEVYRAIRTATKALVALKVMRRNVGRYIKANQRFFREIDTLAALQHSRIVALLDHGYANGYLYFAMPFYKHGNVADWVKRRGQPTLDEAVLIILDILEGLAYAHEQGYVHRDIKPQNLLLDEQNRVIVADFGLAKEVEVERRNRVDASEVISRGPITSVHTGGNRPPPWIGTPEFMPPEQVHNFRGLRPSSDVWAVGAVFHWLLYGPRPPNAWAKKIEWHRSRLPDALLNLFWRATSDYSEIRPQNAAEFRSLLAEAMKTVPDTS